MIPRGDRRFFWIVTTGVLLLTLVPHLVGWGRVLRGDFDSYQAYNTFGAADTNVYFSYMNQARHGAWLFENLFTSEPQRAVIFQPVWLIGGWLGAITTVSTPVAFQLLRLIAGVFLLIVAYRFFLWLGLDENERRFALILVACSSGLGVFLTSWHDFILYQHLHSSDLSIAESNTFASLYHSALFPFTQAMIILAIQFFIDAWRKKRSLWQALGIVFIISFVHTYDLVTIGSILAALGVSWLLTNEFAKGQDLWRYLRLLWPLALSIIPAAIYFITVLYREPAVAGWLKQNITLSPSVWAYLLGYGLLVPLAGFGISHVLRQKRRDLYLLIVWLITSSVLIYLPYLSFQRRLSSGLHVPLAIVAALGLVTLWRFLGRYSRALRFGVVGVLLFGLIATPLGIVIRDSMQLAHQNVSDHAYFFSTDETQAQKYLLEHAGSVGVVYGDPWQSNQLASLGLRVFIGHGHQTVDWETKRTALDGFFSTWTEAERQQYFGDHQINWLYYGTRERKLGPWDPAMSHWLVKVFQAGPVVIYNYPAITTIQ